MDFRSDFLTTLSLELAILNIFTLKKVINHYNSLLPQQSRIVYNEDNYRKSYTPVLTYTTDIIKEVLKANRLIMNDYECTRFFKSWNIMPHRNYQTKEELEKDAINNVATLR